MTPPRWLNWPAAAGGGGLWSPSSLSSLQAWFDADAIGGLSDGDMMSSWSDSSGNGNTVTNSQPSLKPTYETNELNGKPVVRFYNSSGFVNSSTSIYASATTNVQVVAVAKWNSVNNVVICDVGSYAPLMRVLNNQVALYAINGGGSAGIGQGTVSGGSWFVGATSIDWPNKIIGASLNGNTPSTTAWNNTATSVGPLSYTHLGVGSRYIETALPFDGDIAEVVIVTNDASSATREKIEGYMAHKWGLTSNLPITHPYKSSAP